ncbi:hypothetical protein TNIN_230601 [Trichonephila inaurata madagascariensis]|uniref:Uncharacterized protein n=1 Tax=Trichonephila inaurata madagascariensis TaxID=2747483 RepID=A0A8X7CE60_9ARAC|nr:hypothetical protein TNIN_230601 [Trichonephila inaurata madagascariensis]
MYHLKLQNPYCTLKYHQQLKLSQSGHSVQTPCPIEQKTNVHPAFSDSTPFSFLDSPLRPTEWDGWVTSSGLLYLLVFILQAERMVAKNPFQIDGPQSLRGTSQIEEICFNKPSFCKGRGRGSFAERAV